MSAVDQQATFTDTSTRISSMEISLKLQALAVVDRQATFITRISSMVIALWLQSVAIVDCQATFTDASTKISSMDIALWLWWTNKPLSHTFTKLSRIDVASSIYHASSTRSKLEVNFHRYFHQNK